MTTHALRDSLQRHPALTYFALTFAISWVGGIAIIASELTGLMATQEEFVRLLPLWVPLLVLGPSLAGVLSTATGGWAALRAYAARLVDWRVGARWYAVALLAAPLYYAATALAFAAVDPAYLPALITTETPGPLLGRSLAIALTAGFFEELGWTGFAVPALRRRHDVLGTGLILGVLWGLWHFLPKIWGAEAAGVGDYMLVDLTAAVVGLTGFRILMVMVYERTGGNLPIGMLMHVGLTTSTLVLQPALTGAPLVRILVVLSIAPWLIVGAVLLRNRRRR